MAADGQAYREGEASRNAIGKEGTYSKGRSINRILS
jgi:hypothetical protein